VREVGFEDILESLGWVSRPREERLPRAASRKRKSLVEEEEAEAEEEVSKKSKMSGVSFSDVFAALNSLKKIEKRSSHLVIFGSSVDDELLTYVDRTYGCDVTGVDASISEKDGGFELLTPQWLKQLNSTHIIVQDDIMAPATWNHLFHRLIGVRKGLCGVSFADQHVYWPDGLDWRETVQSENTTFAIWKMKI
jgi:hypothetical protein